MQDKVMPAIVHVKPFSKVNAKYYIKWFHDCHESAIWCRKHDDELGALTYLHTAKVYLNIIMENWEAIEFFSIGDNAFLVDSALPERFRGYK